MVVVILLFSFTYIAESNGSVRTYEKKITKLHEIGLGTVPETPTRGLIHFAAYVKNINSGLNYMNAEIYLTAYLKESDNHTVGPLKMVNSVMDPTYYEADFPLGTKGIWEIKMIINTEDGASASSFEVKVHDPNPVVPILTLMFLIVLLLVMGFSIRAWIKEYKKRRD